MKTVQLLVLMDSTRKNLCAAGVAQNFECADIIIGRYETLATESIRDPTDCKDLYKIGDVVPDDVYPTKQIRLLKIKYKGDFIWVDHSKDEIQQKCQDCCLTSNVAPTISLASDFATRAFGNPFTFTATVADSDGTITDVKFYEDDTLLGTDALTPFVLVKSDWAIGQHEVRAVVTDNLSKKTWSNTVRVQVT